jgi:hypothetical protein
MFQEVSDIKKEMFEIKAMLEQERNSTVGVFDPGKTIKMHPKEEYDTTIHITSNEVGKPKIPMDVVPDYADDSEYEDRSAQDFPFRSRL